ncbi:MAG: histidine phosphatase family protein [Oscillospiraceae bacterium]|jgi:alpha-ribazole phosphatase|nr:histidine phosphatase family protein [Oscillospiraceae bacterium]
MKTYKIHFIRHGEISESNTGQYIGKTDSPLSAQGKQALKKLDSEYNYPYATVIFSSPLKRCTETCKIIYPHLNPIVIDQLAECDFGEWEGKTAEQLQEVPEFAQWLAGDNSINPPNGESGADFVRRVCLCFENVVNSLLKSGITDCAIVTHGGVIGTLLSVYGLPSAKPFEWQSAHGCGFSVRISTALWQRDKVAEVFARTPLLPNK